MDREGGFARLVKHLRPHGEVVTYDRRGYGRSASVPGERNIAAHIDDLLSIVGTEPSILIGHSLGGALALGLASREPSLVLGAAVYEPPMSWEPWWTGRTVDDSRRDPRSTGDVAEAFMRRFVGDERWDRLPQRIKEARRAEGDTLVAETVSLRAGRPWDPANIRCPVIAGSGGRSRDDFRRSARLIGETNADCRAVEITEAHHNAHAANPESFFEKLVRPLLTRLETGEWHQGTASPTPITG